MHSCGNNIDLHLIKHALDNRGKNKEVMIKRKGFVFILFEGQILKVFCPQDNFCVVISDNYSLPTGSNDAKTE